jgi:hypothetical protein
VTVKVVELHGRGTLPSLNWFHAPLESHAARPQFLCDPGLRGLLPADGSISGTLRVSHGSRS